MSAGATTLPLPRSLRRPDRAGRRASRQAVPEAARDSVVLRLVAFACLATFAAIHWVRLLADPPAGRVALAVAVTVAAAAAMAWIARVRIPRVAGWALCLAVALVAVGTGAVAVGLPARLLAPGGWGELAAGLNRGLSALGTADLPYTGAGWSRLAILAGLPLCLGLAAALAFWPARRRAPTLRTLALVILVATYGVGVTESPPGAPLLHGLALLVLVAAWLWLPRLSRRDALAGGALILVAGLVALPLAGGLGSGHPWLDYRNWDWAWYKIGGGESFDWNHSYGPIDWPRTGKTLLEVQSDAPHFWRTATLDEFDGTRWLQSGESSSGNVELPASTTGTAFSAQTVQLNPDWIDDIQVTVRDLSSQLVVGAGTVLSVNGAGGVIHSNGGVILAGDQPISDGNSYTVRAYVPDPSPDQMRTAPKRYPQGLAPYAALQIPPGPLSYKRLPGPSPQRLGSTLQSVAGQLFVPWWGSDAQPAQRRVAQALSASPYGGVYRLAHRLTAGAPTAYDAVNAVEGYLKRNYRYSETPPARTYPLRAFLFKDRIGYCQQFSGAMALMLRMVGIPSRVATGFSPGSPSQSDSSTYVVSDLDAHSWVEVYFNGIGWVPFDPTPSAAPAQSQSNGLGVFREPARGGKTFLPPTNPAPAPEPIRPATPSASRNRLSPSLLPLVPLLLAVAVAAGAAALWVRARRRRPVRSKPAGSEARLRELEAALRRLGKWMPDGMTLLGLEQRLARGAGPAAAAYAAKLRAARYSPRDPGQPSAAERRALRRELTSGRGLRARIRGFLAIPPGGPVTRGRLRS